MTLLWLGVLAQVLADFVLQTDRLAKMKSEIKLRAFVEHGLALFLCTFALTHFYGLKPALGFSSAAALVHVLIDCLKSFFAKRFAGQNSAITGFILDQLAHLYTLFLLWFLFANVFTVKPNETILALYSTVFPGIDLPGLLNSHLEKIVVASVVSVYVLFGGAVLNRILLDCLLNAPKDSTLPAIGKWIGILQRAIILIFVACNEITAVALRLDRQIHCQVQTACRLRGPSGVLWEKLSYTRYPSTQGVRSGS
ncbi:DUF3307 domain-containing protein [Desulforudis sp. 1088]|uniref:DUF3307 domain-containing protein n=2 Tax=Candidatus Desulforudis TaxID=471826 RepID=UPI003CF0C029